MNHRLLFTSLALGLLVLALAGWFVQALRTPSRLLVAAR
jgi:hypothetical protein